MHLIINQQKSDEIRELGSKWRGAAGFGDKGVRSDETGDGILSP